MHLAISGLSAMEFSYDLLHSFLTECVVKMEMHSISSPWLYWNGDKNWDAFQFIAESHISVHAVLPEVWVDCVSCKPFDYVKMLEFSRTKLQLKDVSYYILNRQSEYVVTEDAE